MHPDATRRFPFSLGTFDYVSSEHMIEHISYSGGLSVLIECRRVPKPSGTIRVSMPDLAFLIDPSKPGKSYVQQKYIRTALAGIPEASGDNPVYIINNYLRNWGHTYIYGEVTLRDAMYKAGFKT